MTVGEISKVIQTWIAEYNELSATAFINYVQIFENRGEIMGCSNPHPHGQIWAQQSIPVEIEKKGFFLRKHYVQTSRTILQDYLRQELEIGERILFENESFVVLVPFWAVWPYEAMILPKKAAPDISSMNKEEQVGFAEAISWLTIRYDNLFKTSFPYSAGIHQAPCNGNEHPEWHWHMSFYPPLLRSATVKKFMVGYELFANPQRDITPEQAVKILKDLPPVHYLEK